MDIAQAGLELAIILLGTLNVGCKDVPPYLAIFVKVRWNETER